MSKKWLFLFAMVVSFSGNAQYDINSFHYGITAHKNLGKSTEGGVGVRMEYAMNCATTFLAEYNRYILFQSGTDEKKHRI